MAARSVGAGAGAGDKGAEAGSMAAEQIASSITESVMRSLTEPTATVEAVQDAVEAALLKEGHMEVARAYMTYRQEHEKIRAEKRGLLECDVLDKVACDFPLSSLRVMAARYLGRDDEGHITETPAECLKRVAVAAGMGDFMYAILDMHGINGMIGPHKHDVDSAASLAAEIDEKTARQAKAAEAAYMSGSGHAAAGDSDMRLIQGALPYAEYDGSEGGTSIRDSFRFGHSASFTANIWHIRSLARLYIRKIKEHPLSGLPDFDVILDMLEGAVGEHIASKCVRPYYDMLASRTFLPNSPTLMNAGGRLGQLSACFVLGMDDTLKSIMKTASDATMIYQSGGGVGINYGALREKNSRVGSTSGVASGPVSFMNIINTITDVVKQGGRRRGANMGVMPVYHPDIEAFITAKTTPGILENFNVSVGMDEDFWRAYHTGGNMILHRQPERGGPGDSEPREPVPRGEINAGYLMNLIAESAWRSAEPGVLFFDNANKTNVLKPVKGELNTTNPCITGDTLVYTADGGMRTAKELYEMHREFDVAIDSRLGKKSARTQGPIFSTGRKQVYKLSTIEGYEINLTGNHQIMTDSRGWVRADELKRGDKIHLLNHEGGFGSKGTHEMGLILGWMAADGTLKKSAGKHIETEYQAVLPFFGKKRELAQMYCDMVNQVIEVEQEICVPAGIQHRRQYTVSVTGVKGRNEVRVGAIRLGRILHAKYGMISAKDIPRGLLNASRVMQRGFLQGIFSGDGTILADPEKGRTIRLTSNNRDTLLYVQRMLLNFGIVSTIYNNRDGGRKLNASHTKVVELMPDGRGGRKEYEREFIKELSISKANIVTFRDKIGFLQSYQKEKLDKVIASFTWGPHKEKYLARFDSLVPSGEETVYDLTEPKTHSFIANGICIHNCAEQWLADYESCNLGSLNVAMFMTDTGEFMWDQYEHNIRLATRFLDNIIDVNVYPIPEIETASLETRRIGIGVMGVADVLIMQGMGYASEEGLRMHERLAERLTYESMMMSVKMARDRGAFPLFKETSYKDGMLPVDCLIDASSAGTADWDGLRKDIQTWGIRNVVTTTVAPTGTISMIAGCSSGIEPVYALVYSKDVTVGGFEFVNPHLSGESHITPEILARIRECGGTLRGIPGLPASLYETYATAMDIHWADHIHVQSVWQRWISNSISKTINMPCNATIQDVKDAYVFAHGTGCKGITIYRDGSRETQVLSSTGHDAGMIEPPSPTRHTLRYMQQILGAVAGAVGGAVDDAGMPAAGRCSDAGCDAVPAITLTESQAMPGTAATTSSSSACKMDDHDASIDDSVDDSVDDSACPNCKSKMSFTEGCRTCYACGLSMCTI